MIGIEHAVHLKVRVNNSPKKNRFLTYFCQLMQRVFIFLMIGQMLLGSMLLPMCDFSALTQLPKMYQAYEKVVSPDEKGVLDFIGDYLLCGKDLLSHNKHDQPTKQGAFQFQCTAVFAMMVHQTINASHPELLPISPVHNVIQVSYSLSDYHSSLLRPPLV